MRLEAALASASRIAFDTAPIIYFVEAHPQYDALVTSIFERVARGEIEGVTSVITLTEVLVHPVQMGNQALHGPRLRWSGACRGPLPPRDSWSIGYGVAPRSGGWMKKVDRSKLPENDLRRYDWSRAVRGRHADKAAAVGRLVRMLDPELAALFPDSRYSQHPLPSHPPPPTHHQGELMQAFQCVQAYRHAMDYRSDLHFWEGTKNAVPNSAKAHLNFSVMKGAKGDLQARLQASYLDEDRDPERGAAQG